MLTMMILIAMSTTLIEMMIVVKNETLRTTFQKYTILGLMFSFGLALTMATLVGASGTIILGAAILSTMMSLAIYSMKLIELGFVVVRQIQKLKTSIKDAYHSVMNAWTKTKRGYNLIRHPITSRKVST